MLVIDYPGLHGWKRSGRKLDRYYDTQKEIKEDIGYLMRIQAENQSYQLPIIGNIGAVLIFYKKRSVNHTKKNRPTFCKVKPDIDNLEKFFFDTAEKYGGIVRNDSRIVLSHTIKLWGDHDRTISILGNWTTGSTIFHSNNMVGFNNVSWCLSSRNIIYLEENKTIQ